MHKNIVGFTFKLTCSFYYYHSFFPVPNDKDNCYYSIKPFISNSENFFTVDLFKLRCYSLPLGGTRNTFKTFLLLLFQFFNWESNIWRLFCVCNHIWSWLVTVMFAWTVNSSLEYFVTVLHKTESLQYVFMEPYATCGRMCPFRKIAKMKRFFLTFCYYNIHLQ